MILLWNYLSTNHIFIGTVYIIPGLIGGPIGFGLPIISRSESASPGSISSSPPQYNANTTFHGICTIPSMTTPILIGGSGNILSPSMLCPSDTIPPRSNALSP